MAANFCGLAVAPIICKLTRLQQCGTGKCVDGSLLISTAGPVSAAMVAKYHGWTVVVMAAS